MALLDVEEASFDYAGVAVFRNVNFSVNKGEIFCLFGPNGCGKTTLLECLLGGLRLTGGSVRLNGLSVESLRPSDMAKLVAYVPQDHHKSFPYSVEEIVLMGRAAYLGLFSAPGPSDYEIAHWALNLVGINRLAKRPYTQISGGEAQLVLLARALAQQAPLIVMDEPTCHLDFRHEIAMLETMVRLVHDTGLTIIMATHAPNHAFYFENNALPIRVALMNHQTFSLTGTPSVVLTEDNLKDLYQVRARVISCYSETGAELKQVMPVSTLTIDKGRD